MHFFLAVFNFFVDHLDDVITELALHRADDVAGIGGESGIGEGLDHRPLFKIPQVALVLSDGGIFRFP